VQLSRGVSLVCLLTALLASSSFGQAAPGYRTRDRQATRGRGNNNNNNANRTRASRATGEFPARNLPAEFAIFQTRSIFSRDRIVTRTTDSSRRTDRQPSENRSSSPVFRGVLNENSTYAAGIERGTGASAITWYHEGQSIRDGGRITQISLDQIIITARNGDRRAIAVGERIDAGTAVARDASRGIATTQPSEESSLTRRDDSDSDE
jgi:hypothetical protein